ncbi:MAG TPA: peroxide stress protein YaaA [Gammaproteobacteria bacterium]|nr:peroxide stress protein YaaA [Gammaproteobacteria bacterium]
MLMVISPAKTLDYESERPTTRYTQPEFLDQSQQLINTLRNYSSLDIAELMKVSMKIADLNFDRYEAWQTPFTPENARQAVLAFKGDVYDGLHAQDFSAQDFDYLQNHLRILSGLYGFLKPLDLMQPYRLEMGTRLKTERGKNLYEFWGLRVTDALNQVLKQEGSHQLINLASNEYFKVIKPKALDADIITPQFKDWKNGQYKMISFYAKKARGMMVRYITQNQLENPEHIKEFDLGGYSFAPEMSEGFQWVFTRRLEV